MLWVGQRSLAHSCHYFRSFWDRLELYPADDNDIEAEDESTACDQWRFEQLTKGGAHLASSVHVQTHLRPTRGAMLQIDKDVLHVSLIGSFTRRELLYIMTQTQLDLRWLARELVELLCGSIQDALKMRTPLFSVFDHTLLTLRLHHGQQRGFSDAGLERFSTLFAGLPIQFASTMDGEGLFSICEPRWCLHSPITYVYVQWNIADKGFDHVAELADVCRV